MTSLAPLGFFDLGAFYASYVGKHRRALVDSQDPRHEGVRYLDLVRGGEPAPLMAEWKPAAAFLDRVRAQLSARSPGAAIENAYVCAFDPDGFEQWGHTPGVDLEVHVLLAPAPGFRLHSGSEAVAPAPWHALARDPRKPGSRSNFDAPNTAHELVIELSLGAPAEVTL
ncbi:MAG: hypothetical protein KGO96_12445 [Elusimicrobia bacterium]|nr:hypothetical protein [Elusimicrobiota bacterium]